MDSDRLKVAFAFVTLCLLWGLSYPIAKIGVRDSTPLVFATVSGLLALFVHAALGWWGGGRHPTGSGFHRVAFVMGIFNVAALSGLLNIGVARVSAGESSILIYTQPIWVGLLAWLLLGERPTLLKTAGLIAGFGGMVLVLSDRIRPGQDSPAWAYAALLGASLSWTVGTIYFKRIQGGFDFLWLNFYQSIYGVAIMGAFAVILENPGRTDWLSPAFWIAAFFFGALASGAGRLLWFYLLKRGQASVVSSYVFLSPLVAVLSGAVILGEALHPLLIAGGAL
ncbi:MAG TPA: DMT family transporter, partial [Dehalococcoidia bacterium]|nr:DMT family transporter [Dehalococcoidia bacterium]